MKKAFIHTTLAILITTYHSKTLSETKALWELGIGAGSLNQPYYTGTKQTRNYGFPVILPIYRGDIFKSDDEGIRAQLFTNDRYKLDISLDFNPSIDSSDINLREGMPNIGHLLQVGPSLAITLLKKEQSTWKINLPLRAVFEINKSDATGRGYNFSPSLSYEYKFSDGPWKFGASVGLQAGSEKYHDVYYTVSPEYARDAREEYASGRGFSGGRLQWVLSAKTPRHLSVWFIRYDTIQGAVFHDSPLVETDYGITAGFIYSYSLIRSTRTVDD